MAKKREATINIICKSIFGGKCVQTCHMIVFVVCVFFGAWHHHRSPFLPFDSLRIDSIQPKFHVCGQCNLITPLVWRRAITSIAWDANFESCVCVRVLAHICTYCMYTMQANPRDWSHVNQILWRYECVCVCARATVLCMKSRNYVK